MRYIVIISASILALCIPVSTRAQDGGATEVTVVREAAPEGYDSFPRGGFLRLHLGGTLPLVGPRAEIGNAGGTVSIAGGAHVLPSLALGLEVEGGVLPENASDGADVFTTLRVGAVARFSVPAFDLFHAFAELDAGLVFVCPWPSEGLSLADARATWTVGSAGGLELDVLDGLSVEGGLRVSFVRTGPVWQGGGDTVLLSPFVGGSWFF